LDFESETFITECLNANGKAAGSATQQDAETGMLVTHSLRADGFDASEDGTGRGTPLVPVGFMPARTFGKDGGIDSRYAPRDVCDALHTASGGGNKAPLIAFSCKDSGADSGEIAPTLRSMNYAQSHANAGGQVAVAFAENQRGELRTSDVAMQLSCAGGKPGSGYPAIAIQERAICENPLAGPDGVGIREDDQAYTVEARQVPQAVAFNLRGREGGSLPEPCDQASLRSASGGSSRTYVAPAMQVRRLTPTECERLQKFPDGYTKISEKTADGPRYKALGNSMAVCCMEWIGKRIQLVDLFS
jgi:DNA (cytosine-5)-methyltransferase 1